MPFPSDFFKSLASLVHQIHGTSNDRAGRGRQSKLTSCLFHQIFSIHLLPLSIRFMDQQWSCWTRPAEQLDIMPFPSDFFKSLASLVHQIHGPAMIVLDEASRATWHHAFSIRFFQFTCFPCPSDSWTSNDRAGGGQQSNLTSCLFHQIFSIHLLPLSIRFMDQHWSCWRGQQSNLTSCLFHQIFSNHLLPLSIRFMDQQWSCWTRPAEQLDIMPFPSDFFKSLASLVHQIHGPAMIVLDEAGRATWHHAFSIRFFQITCFPCPSDSWTSNDRAGRGQQSNLTSCLFHQIFSNHLLPLSIRFLQMICEARATSVRTKVAWLHVQTCWVVETRIYILHYFTSLIFMQELRIVTICPTCLVGILWEDRSRFLPACVLLVLQIQMRFEQHWSQRRPA